MSVVAINRLARLLDVSGAFTAGTAPVCTAEGVFEPAGVVVNLGVSGSPSLATPDVFPTQLAGAGDFALGKPAKWFRTVVDGVAVVVPCYTAP